MGSDNLKIYFLLINLVLSFMGVGQVWQVQLSSYPLWAYVGANELHNYHIAWWHSIWVPLFIPAGLSTICTVVLFWFRPITVPRSLIWAAVSVLLIIYFLTAIWFGPLMALIGSTPQEFAAVFSWAPLLKTLGLNSMNNDQLYHLLLATHWFRFALLNIYGILLFWISIIAFDLKIKGSQL